MNNISIFTKGINNIKFENKLKHKIYNIGFINITKKGGIYMEYDNSYIQDKDKNTITENIEKENLLITKAIKIFNIFFLLLDMFLYKNTIFEFSLITYKDCFKNKDEFDEYYNIKKIYKYNDDIIIYEKLTNKILKFLNKIYENNMNSFFYNICIYIHNYKTLEYSLSIVIGRFEIEKYLVNKFKNNTKEKNNNTLSRYYFDDNNLEQTKEERNESIEYTQKSIKRIIEYFYTKNIIDDKRNKKLHMIRIKRNEIIHNDKKNNNDRIIIGYISEEILNIIYEKCKFDKKQKLTLKTSYIKNYI